jgi:hypothetical protein
MDFFLYCGNSESMLLKFIDLKYNVTFLIRANEKNSWHAQDLGVYLVRPDTW